MPALSFMQAADTTLGKKQREIRLWLADNLRLQRQAQRLSQERASEQVEFTLQYYQRIERGIVNVPLDTLTKLAVGFGVSVAKLLVKPKRKNVPHRVVAQRS